MLHFALAPALLALPQVPAHEPTTWLLTADRVLDVRAGRVLADTHVLVVGDRVEAVGVNPADTPAIPVTDLGDVTLMPGYIDCHTHVTASLEPGWEHAAAVQSTALQALRGAHNARTMLRNGFTTVRDVGASGFADVDVMRAIESGWAEGPRIVPAGHAIGITGGHCDATGYAPGVLEGDWRNGVADGPDECVKAVRYQAKHGAKVIKVCATAGVLSFEGSVGAQQLSDAELRAIVAEADRHGLKVAAHAHGAVGIRAAVLAGVASIEHGSELTDEVMALMKARGTYLVPTTYLTDDLDLDVLPGPIRAKAEAIIPIARDSLRRAIAAGVPIAFGTDAGVFPHAHAAREFGALVDRGMSPADALRAATVNAADLLGTTDRGEIAAGKLADLVAVEGDPLEDVTATVAVRWVMKGGRVVRDDLSE